MSRYEMCPECGRRMNRVKDSYGNWDGETYTCTYCASNYYESDDVPEGCRECGGDYPNCADSCSMFDD